MKKIFLAAVLVASATSAQAAVTYNFGGTEFEGAAVSGTLTIDTDALAGIDPAALSMPLGYYFATGDAASNSALPFLSVSFTSAGSNPALLTTADYTYQSLQADPSDGSLSLELDYQIDNGDGTFTSSTFSLSGFELASTSLSSGVVLPDFAHAGTVYFSAQSGTGSQESYDVTSAGSLTFSAAGAVPEASTWAMMALGFGAVGYAARRRTRVTIAA